MGGKLKFLFVFRNFHGNLRDVRRILWLAGHEVKFVCEFSSSSEPPDFGEQIILPSHDCTRETVESVFNSFKPDVLIHRNLSRGARLFWRVAKERGVSGVFYDQDPYIFPTLYGLRWPLRFLRFWITRVVTRVMLGKHRRVTPVFQWGAGPRLPNQAATHFNYPSIQREISAGILNESRPTVVTVAKLGQPRKRLVWLLRALAELQIPSRLVIIGWRPETRNYVRNHERLLEKIGQVESEALEIRVHENLNPAQVREIYKSSSLFVLPSVKEPFAISPLEAMQHGIPVLVGSDGGAVSYVEASGREQVFRAGSYRSFREKLRHLLENSEVRGELSEKVLLRLQEAHSTRAFFAWGEEFLETIGPKKLEAPERPSRLRRQV